VLQYRFNKLDNEGNVGKKMYPHSAGRTQTKGEKDNLHFPHQENLKERKNFV